MQSANLMPRHRLDARQRRNRLRLWLAGGSIYAALVLGGYVLCCSLWAGNPDALTEELQDASRRIGQSRSAASNLQRELAAAEATLKANESVGKQPDWSLLLRLLSKCTGPDVILRQCRLNGESSQPARDGSSKRPDQGEGRFILRLAGYGQAQASVSKFVFALEQTTLFEEVKLVRARREPFLSGHAVAFQVDCVLGESASGGDQ